MTTTTVLTPVYGASPVKHVRRTKREIAELRDLLERVLRQYQPMTVRQVFYRLVALGVDRQDRGRVQADGRPAARGDAA